MDALVHGQGSSSLMHESMSGGGIVSGDLYFDPDDTYYIGYDPDLAICGRPREIQVTRIISIGGTSNNYDPRLNFVRSGSCASPNINAWVNASFYTNIDGIVTPFEIWSDTPYPIYIHSDTVLGTSPLDGAIIFSAQEAVAGAANVDDHLFEFALEDGASVTPYVFQYFSGAGQLVARGFSDDANLTDVIAYGIVPQQLTNTLTDTYRAGLEINGHVGELGAPSTLSLWGTKNDAPYAGTGLLTGVNAEVMADVNNATLDLDMAELIIRWRDNADTESDLIVFKRDQIELIDGDVGYLLGTDADGAAAVGARVGSDLSFTTEGARLVEWVNNTAVRGFLDFNGDLSIGMLTNGQALGIETATVEQTIAAAATTLAALQIPAGALVIAVSSYVVTTLPTATTYDVGITGAATRYSAAVASVAGADDPGTQDAIRYYLANTSILITPDLTPATATGVIRLTIHYIIITPPTS